MNLEGLNVKISASISDFNNKMNRVEGRLSGMGKVAKTVGTTGAIALGAITTALGAVATATGVVGVQYDAMMEQSKVAWTTLLKDAGEAEKMLKRISDFTKATPFETETVDMMAKYMHNASLEGDDLFKALMQISDVASAFAIPQAEAKEMARQMSQVRQAGVAYTEDLNILQDRGVPIFKAIAEQQGIMVKDVKKMASEGKITSDIYVGAFNSIAEGVEGASKEQSKTLNGMISTLKDSLKMLSGALAKPMFDKLKAGLEKVLPLLDTLLNIVQGGGSKADLAKALGIPPSVVDGIIGAVTTVKDTFTSIFEWYVSNVQALFSGDGNLGESFMRIFGVIRDVALPIFNDAVAFIQEKLAVLKAFWDENGAQIIEAVKNMWAVIASIFEFIAPVLLFIVTMIWDSVKGVINGALNIIMGLIKIFAGLFTGDFGKMWEGVKQLFAGALEFLWNLMNLMFIGKIFSGIKAFGTKSVSFFKEFGKKVIAFFKDLWTKLWGKVDKFVDDIVKLWQILRAYGDTIFQAMRQIIKNIFDDIVKGVTGKVKSLKETAISIFKGLQGAVKTIFNTIKGLITNPIETAKKTVLGIIDAIKGAFTKMKITIPKPKLPKVSVSMKTGVMGIPYPDFDINWYAKGGIFNGASVIGVGERGTEAVVPLQGHRMKPFAETVAKEMPQSVNGGGVTVHVAQLVVREEADVKRVAQELHGLQKRNKRQGGRG